MPSKPTRQVLDLKTELEKRGVKSVTEYNDGHKHVDLYIPTANIYIEVDGIQHLINPDQIIADFKREHYSDMAKYDTLHINNDILENHLERISEAITKVVLERKQHNS